MGNVGGWHERQVHVVFVTMYDFRPEEVTVAYDIIIPSNGHLSHLVLECGEYSP